MPGTGDRLRAELERFVRPADPSGVFEAIVQRRARRETIRKLRFGVLAVALVMASGVGFVALSRIFRVSPVAENRSSASVSVHPSTSPTNGPGVTNVGLAFPLCNVRTLAADFDGD